MNHIRLAVTATALVVAFAVAAIFVLNGSSRPTAVSVLPAGGRTAQPSAAASPVPSSEPGAVAGQAPLQLADFGCASSTVPTKAAGPIALVSTMRTGSHAGYDRFVIEFASGVPGVITVTPQSRPTFLNSPRGDAVTLAGSAGLLVRMHDADAHTSYAGPATLRPNGASIVEIRRLEDFEGYVGLGLGVAKSSCYRAFMLASPTRLVIDVQVA